MANLYRPLVTIPICSMGLEMFVGKYSSPMGHFGYVTIPTFVRLNPYKDNTYQDEGGSEKLTKTKSWKANRILKKHWVETGFTHPFFRGETLNITGAFS